MPQIDGVRCSRRYAVIENEFGDAAIDEMLLEEGLDCRCTESTLRCEQAVYHGGWHKLYIYIYVLLCWVKLLTCSPSRCSTTAASAAAFGMIWWAPSATRRIRSPHSSEEASCRTWRISSRRERMRPRPLFFSCLFFSFLFIEVLDGILIECLTQRSWWSQSPGPRAWRIPALCARPSRWTPW